MATFRKDPLVNEQYYHIYSRSIAKYVIFNDSSEFERMLDLINLYRFCDFDYKYSRFKQFDFQTQSEIIERLKNQNKTLVDIIAYSIMPTHIHLVLKQNTDDGITKYMSRILNSYAKYFNQKHHRLGHLWSQRFQNVLVNSDEQLLHLTRYAHLNATSAGLVKKPEDWFFSSYLEYIKPESSGGICNFDGLFDLTPAQYQKFVNDRKSYQRDLSIIKNILIDDYSG